MGVGAGRRAQAQADARARFERDREAAQAAEARRQQQLAAYQREYQRRAEAQQAEVGRHNAAVSEMTAGLRDGDPDATVEYFSAALYASSAWPADLPRQVSAAYDPAARRLVLNWELPTYGVVPEVKSVRYMPTADQDKEYAAVGGAEPWLYRDVLAQCVLLVLHALFAADEFGVLESVALERVRGRSRSGDRQGGADLPRHRHGPRSVFARLRLEQVNAVDCLVDGLRGSWLRHAPTSAADCLGRHPEDIGNGVVTHGGAQGANLDGSDLNAPDLDEPDLYEMISSPSRRWSRSCSARWACGR